MMIKVLPCIKTLLLIVIYGGCGFVGGFSLVLDVVMVVGQFSGGPVLFSK